VTGLVVCKMLEGDHGAHIDLVCTPRLVGTEGPLATQNGGYLEPSLCMPHLTQ